ncbi:MAG TPA: PA14 domain-containing protein [Chloroflexia bacterium]
MRLGGAGADYGFGLEIDHRGNIYVSGATTSSDFPKGSSQSTTSGGSDAFLMKIAPINSCAMTLEYTMFVGGDADDHSYDVALDKWGFGLAFITGSTESSNFNTVNPYQPVYGGNVDAFITMVAGVHGLPPATPQVYELRCGGSLSEASTTRSAGNSVNTATGNLCYGSVDIAIPAGHGLPLVFGRTYNSDLAEIPGPLGYGWTFNYNMYVEKDEVSGLHFVHEENGSVIPFGADFTAPTRVMATLANNSGNYVFVRPGAQQIFTFEAGHAPGYPQIYKLIRIEDYNGFVTQLKYHASSGLLEEVTDPSGRTLNLHYNTEGPLTGLLNWIDAPRSFYDPTDTGPLTVHFDYDADGNLEEVTDVAGNATGYGYSPGHLLHTVTDPRGKVLQTDYYDDKRVKKQIDPMAHTVEFGYSGVTTSALTTWITDAVKLVNVHKYDHFMIQEVTEHVGPKQAVWKYGYKQGTTWVSKVTDPYLRDWTYDYDDKGTQILSVDPLGRSTTATTIPQGYLFHNVTDARGNTTTNLYDDYGNLVRVERLHQESGELASVNYTTDNNLGYRGDVREIYSQDAVNEQTELIYDYEGLSPPGFCEYPNQPPFGYLRATVKRPTNDMSWVCFDNLGLLQRTRDTKGNDTSYVYNAYGDPIKVTDPLGGVTEYQYDANRNLRVMTDTAQTVTKYDYNDNNELTRILYPDLTHEDFEYDAAGRVTTQTNALGKSTITHYDDVNRQVKVTDPLTRETITRYDLVGNAQTIVDARQQTVTLGYDKAYQLKTVDYSDPTTADVAYDYNEVGARSYMTDSTGVTRYEYDSLNRLDYVVDGAGRKVDYSYDLDNRLTTLSYPVVGATPETVTYDYDAANRRVKVSDWKSNSAYLTYDSNGNLSSIGPTQPSTTIPSTGLEYDKAGRVLTMTHSLNSTAFLKYGYDRHPTGLLQAARETSSGQTNTHTYGYDERYRLTADQLSNNQAKNLTWDYDNASQIWQSTYHDPLNGLLTTSTRLYDAANQLRSITDTQELPATATPTKTATSTPTNTATPTPAFDGVTRGLKGEYFSRVDLTSLKFTAYDSEVNYNWGHASPDPSIPTDNFSIRWTGQVKTPAGSSGTYTFYTMSDDGVRLWVNGQQVVNNWTNHGPTENSGTITLEGGQLYDIKLEYYEAGGTALIQLLWQPPNGTKALLPSSNLYPASAPAGTHGLKSDFFLGQNLSDLRLTRYDGAVDNDWGNSYPDSVLTVDNFSARWTGSIQTLPQGGTYTFYTVSDDGVRLWVDDQLIINDWTVHAATERSATIALQGGHTYNIKLEFFENVGGALVQMLWLPPGGQKQVVPVTQLFPVPASQAPSPTPTYTATSTPTSRPSNCQAVTWAGMQNVTVTGTGNSIKKTSGGEWVWDATGVSSKGILSGDGSVQATLNGGDGSRRHFGLGIGNSNASYEDVDYAFVVQNAGVFIWENNSEKANLGSKAVGSVLKVAVESGVVKYYINDALVYTSAKVPTYPLIFDDSIANLGGKIQNAYICSGNLSLYSGANNASAEAADAESLRRSTVTDTSTSDNSDSTQAANTPADSLAADYNTEGKSVAGAVQATETVATLPTVVPGVTETTKDRDKDKDKDKDKPEYFKPASLNSPRGFSKDKDKDKDKANGTPSPTYTAASGSTAYFTPTFTPTPDSSAVATSMMGGSDSVTATNLTPTGTAASSTANTTGTSGTSGAVNATVTTLTADATSTETLNSTPTSSGAGAGTGSTDPEARYEAEGKQQGSETQNHVFADLATDSTFYSYIQEAYGLGIVGGYPDGTFRPQAPASRGQFMKIIVLAFGLPLTTNETTGETGAESQHFIDVPTTHTFYRYIEAAYEHGIVSGYPGGLFKPEGTVTRGQVAKVVILAGRFNQLQPEKQTFTDVPSDSPFYTYIETAYANGILGGYSNGTFGPEAEATRGQISKIALLSARAARNSNTSSNSSPSGEGSAAGTGGTDQANSAQSYSLNGEASSPDGVGLATVVDLSFEYDNNGNRISRTDHLATTNSTTTYKYNQANNLVTYDNAIQYQYNGDGLRMKKVHATATPYPQIEQYTWDVTGVGGDSVPMLLEDSNASYVYGPGGLLLWEITSTGQTNRYHTDQLGSVRAITNSQGAVVATYEYDPYGNVISSTGSIATRSGYFGYAGEYTDRESKLVYLRARYYDPSTQQFINRDPLVGASGEPYGYVGGSPLNGRDPTGLWWETPLDILSLYADLLDVATNGLNWTNGIAIGADIVGLALPVVGGLGFVIRGGKMLAHGGDAVTLYRVEGLGNERFLIDAAGNVKLQGEKMIHVSFDASHAAYFLQKRLHEGYPDAIKAFEVESSFLQTLRADRVPQRGASRYPGRPQWVDRRQCTDCYGIPHQYFDQLQQSIIQGTGRIYWP